MQQLFKMAFRDILRHKRRSIFSAIAMGLGLTLLLMFASFIEGEMRGSMATSIKLDTGHIQIQAQNYDKNKNSLVWENLIANPVQVANQISNSLPVIAATPRLFASGVVTQGNASTGVRVVGIDPGSPANEPYKNGIVAGEFLKGDDNSGILIGKPLANQYKLKPGDSINLLVNTSNGDVDQQQFTIRGIFSTESSGLDKAVVFLTLPKAQAITQAGDHASIIFILLKDKNQTDEVINAIQAPGLKIVSWAVLNSFIMDFQQYADSFMSLFYLIILAITATVIINTLIMAVYERTREIGILSAIGMKSRSIMGVFFIESAILAFGGIIIGWILGGMVVAYLTLYGFYIGNFGLTGFTTGDTIHAYLTLSAGISLTALTLIVALLAAIYPAWLAARMEPVDALRNAQ
jgi:ABC-type lipoprotein release transport system permease subunit